MGENTNLIHYYVHKGSEATPENIVVDVSHLEKYSDSPFVIYATIERIISDMIKNNVDFCNFTISSKTISS